ncbi:MAG: hypothetical protein KF861_22325, partial [Planctomycetaceae bacterium]|nr:hypothetical protein [Planctomycetaceae bacterium]
MTAVLGVALTVGFCLAQGEPDRPEAADPGSAANQTQQPSLPAGPSSVAAASPTAVDVLRSARDALIFRRSVSAKLRQQVSIGGTQFEASGTYEASEFPRFRLNYEVEVGQTSGTLLEICDGPLLWTVQEVGKKGGEARTVKVSRTVIAEVSAAGEDNRDVPEAL